MRRLLIAALAAFTLLAIGSTSALAAPPATLNITLGAQPNSGITLGQQAGEKVCTGEGDARTCVTPIGLQTTLRDTVPVTDNNTGRKGTMTITCDVMFSGTTTSYQTTTGSTEATGSQDCVMKMMFDGGDVVWGSQNQSRVVSGSTQRSTFDIFITGGAGLYEGFQAKIQSQETNNWTPPGPMNQDGGKRLALPTQRLHAGPLGRAGGVAKFKRSAKSLASFASIGALLPKNKPVVVKTAAAPGATCSGSVVGASTIALAAVKANAKGTATFKALAAGTFGAGGAWNATVTCTGGGMGKAVAKTALTAFDVLK